VLSNYDSDITKVVAAKLRAMILAK
jgi:hypothetical protein